MMTSSENHSAQQPRESRLPDADGGSKAAPTKSIADGIERGLAARASGPHRKDALTEPLLKTVLLTIGDGSQGTEDAALGKPSLRDARDSALLGVGFASGMRTVNYETAVWGHATVYSDRVDLSLESPKTGSAADRHVIPLPITNGVTSPGAALLRWCERVAWEVGGSPLEIAREMPLFPAIQPAGNAFKQPVRAVSGEDVDEVVRRRARDAGLSGDFDSQSLRYGLVSTLLPRGITLANIARLLDWKLISMVQRYDRTYAVPLEVMRALWPDHSDTDPEG
jgi:hypothetical protein